MRKRKYKIILAIIVLALLSGAWIYSAVTQSPVSGGSVGVAPPADRYASLIGDDGAGDALIASPNPAESQDAAVSDVSFLVTLTVRCDTILDNIGMLKTEKHGLVPADGVIFQSEAAATPGESVFDVLQREMRGARIHMAFRNTPFYDSAYIEAINNLYEYDVGELSGWVYMVNGVSQDGGCSQYKLAPGDVVEWLYTCDLGRDLD